MSNTTYEIIAFLAALGWLGVAVIAVSLLIVAARADRLADRMLGPGSSSDDKLDGEVLRLLDEDPNPHGRRH